LEARLTAALLVLAAVAPKVARADGPTIHLRAGPAHAITEPQATELAWGGSASVVGEIPLWKLFRLHVAAGGMALAQGQPPKDRSLAPRGPAGIVSATGGPRLRLGGFWAEGGGGVAWSGDVLRPAVAVAIGYDVPMGRSGVGLGPFLGYLQVIQPDDELRPEDARIFSFGVQVSFGRAPAPRAPAVFDARRDKRRGGRAPTDRDGDGIADTFDRCPDVAGPATGDPETNGCPPDTDRDGVANAQDACPEIPGVRTGDPSTNGCPPTRLRLVGNRIELPDRIYFEFRSPRVLKESLPLLRNVAEYVNSLGDVVAVDIEGHTDEIGSDAYNQELSAARAEAVRAWLERFGAHPKLISRGFGKSRPRAPGHTPEARRENRRVEFYVRRDLLTTDSWSGPHASN
jgi:outer membrane protein OmpA-like peptidoglycan-associated protein